jgi:hypothetical protein
MYATSDAVGTELVENLGERRTRDPTRFGRREIEKVAVRACRLADCDQVLEDVVLFRQRCKHGDGSPSLGHDEPFSSLDPP